MSMLSFLRRPLLVFFLGLILVISVGVPQFASAQVITRAFVEQRIREVTDEGLTAEQQRAAFAALGEPTRVAILQYLGGELDLGGGVIDRQPPDPEVLSRIAGSGLSSLPRVVDVLRAGPLGAGLFALRDIVGGIVRGVFNALISAFLMIYNFLMNILVWFTGILMSVMGIFIDFFLDIRRLAGSPVVQTSWQFVRDSLNFVFILALLAIAFATIAGIESYNMKQMLSRVIMAALLVNFSLAISGAFLQVASVLVQTSIRTLERAADPTCQLVAGQTVRRGGTSLTCRISNAAQIRTFYTAGTSRLLTTFGLPGLRSFNRVGGIFQWNFSVFSDDVNRYIGTTVSATAAAFFIVVFTIALTVLCVSIGVRTVVLFILLVLSPVPYVFSIVPAASEWGRKWWESFLRYTFFLPVLVFFLVLAVHILEGTRNFLQEQFQADPRILAPLSVGGIDGAPIGLVMFNTIFMSTFIIVSIMVARSMSIYGAGGVIGYANRFARRGAGMVVRPAATVATVAAAPAVIGGRAAGYGLRGIGRAIAPKIPGLMAARNALRGTQALYTGRESAELVAEQQKAIKGYSSDKLKTLMNGGNAGAAAELLDRGDLSDEKDFKQARSLLPGRTTLSEKLNKAYKGKFGFSAATGISHDRVKNILAGRERLSAQETTEATQKAKEIKDNLKKMKEEDVARNQEQIRMALKLGIQQIIDPNFNDQKELPISLTPDKINQYARHLDKEGQDELQALLTGMKNKQMLSGAQKKAAEKQVYT